MEVDWVMGKRAFAAVVLAGMAVWWNSAGAEDGLELTQRLGSQHFDESALRNGFRITDYASGAVADDLKPYGVVGVAYLQFDNNTGSDAGRRTGGYYVFSSPEAARAFPEIFLAELRKTGQPNWTSEVTMTLEDQRRGDITGSCIGSDGLGQIVCLYVDPGGQPVMIQITGPLPGLPADLGADDRDNAIGSQAADVSYDLMAGLRQHLETAAGGGGADQTQIDSDPASIAERLLNLPVDGSMVGAGYLFDGTFSLTGDAIPQGWDMQKIIALIFRRSDGGPGDIHAGYMIFPSNEAARTFYDGYPDALKAEFGAQGWVEAMDLSHESDDPMRTFKMPCVASEAGGVATCIEDVTGTPVVIAVYVPTPPVDGMGSDDRSLAIGTEATTVVSALLPAVRAHLADAMTSSQ